MKISEFIKILQEYEDKEIYFATQNCEDKVVDIYNPDIKNIKENLYDIQVKLNYIFSDDSDKYE